MKATMVLLAVLLFLITLDQTSAQSSQVGIIDYYGRSPSRSKLQTCLPFALNDTVRFLTDSITYANAKRPIVACLLGKPGVKQADISFVCCDAVEGKWMAFIGASDKPKAKDAANSKTKELKLPTELVKSYDSLMNLLLEAIQSGQAAEDDSEGHAFFEHPPSHKIQERFKIYAEKYRPQLSEVIRNSKYPHQREVAATIIAYYHDKKAVVDDLVIGAGDEDAGVRNDAVRALGIILNYSQKRPELKITIPPDPFIAMMNSISWTDRNKSVMLLLTMSSQRAPKLLQQLKSTILESLVDMAKWKSEGHAMGGYMILGRIAGWTDKEIFDGSKSDRLKAVDSMLKQIK